MTFANTAMPTLISSSQILDAAPQGLNPPSPPAPEFLSLRLRHGLRVGLPAPTAVEVLSIHPNYICPLPGVHPLLLGVTPWRGQMLWVLNLSDLLGLKVDPQERLGQTGFGQSTLTSLVMAQGFSQSFSQGDGMGLASAVAGGQSNRAHYLALLIHGLEEIVSVSDSAILPVPQGLPVAAQRYFRGLAALESPLLLLDPAALIQGVMGRGQSG